MSHKKIVITGASGFLGRNLLDTLKDKEGFHVFALSSREQELQSAYNYSGMEFYNKDVLFEDVGKDILDHAMVVNCAFPRNYNGTEIAEGLKYIEQLFTRSSECGVKAILNISSQSVYSQTRMEAATEEMALSLDNSYAVGKYASELLLESVCDGTGIYYTNLRMASLIGPGFNQRIVNRLVKQALDGSSVRAVRSQQRFGFLDVKDAVNAVVSLLNYPVNMWKQVYNGGNNTGYTIEEIMACISDVFEELGLRAPEIAYEEGTGSANTAVSYSVLNSDTGYEPEVDLRNSVMRILEWYQKN